MGVSRIFVLVVRLGILPSAVKNQSACFNATARGRFFVQFFLGKFHYKIVGKLHGELFSAEKIKQTLNLETGS
jgi:hypothetical protein